MTYDYRCGAGHVHERQERITAPVVPVACPTCGELATRLISVGAGVIFRGSGFYATDYKKRSKAAVKDEIKSEMKSIGAPEGDLPEALRD